MTGSPNMKRSVPRRPRRNARPSIPPRNAWPVPKPRFTLNGRPNPRPRKRWVKIPSLALLSLRGQSWGYVLPSVLIRKSNVRETVPKKGPKTKTGVRLVIIGTFLNLNWAFVVEKKLIWFELQILLRAILWSWESNLLQCQDSFSLLRVCWTRQYISQSGWRRRHNR